MVSSIKTSLVLGLASLGFMSGTAEGSPQVAVHQFQELWTCLVREASRFTTCTATQEEIASDTLRSLSGRDPKYIQRCLRRTVRNKLLDRKRKDSKTTALSEMGEGGTESQWTDGALELAETAEVREFRATLDDDERRILELMEGGHTEREMASVLDTTRAHVRKVKRRLEDRASSYFIEA